MRTEIKHTPTPVVVTHSADTSIVMTTVGIIPVDVIRCHGPRHAATAERLAMTYNLHDELAAALEQSLAWLGRSSFTAAAKRYGNVAHLHRDIEKIKDVLAKVNQ